MRTTSCLYHHHPRRLWLSTVRMSLSTEGPAVDLTLSVASAELWEYLYRNEVKLAHITKPISVSPVSYSLKPMTSLASFQAVE